MGYLVLKKRIWKFGDLEIWKSFLIHITTDVLMILLYGDTDSSLRLNGVKQVEIDKLDKILTQTCD